MKVKIFRESNTGSLDGLNTEIQNWLDRNYSKKIKFIKQSEGKGRWLTLTIWYEEAKDG